METFDLSSLSCRRIWLLTWPVMVSLLMQHLIGMTDTAFLGRVGEVELGAAALGSIYYLAVYMIGFGFSNFFIFVEKTAIYENIEYL